MEIHFLVYFIGILTLLTIVHCNVENYEQNNINSPEKGYQDDNGTVNGMSLNMDKSKTNEEILTSMDLRKKKCGKTKQVCKDAGGYCLAKSKEDKCDGKMLKGKIYCAKNRKCSCCIPEGQQPCTRSGGGSCADYTYRRIYTTSGKPCVFADIGISDHIYIENECGKYLGDQEERCIYQDAINEPIYFEVCGGTCDIPEKFRRDHMCSWCNDPQDAMTFTINRTDSGHIFRNHVFRSALSMGKKDWTFNSNPSANALQPICRIPEYVWTWYCQKRNNAWKCKDYGYYTGGGIAYGVQGHVAGHFLTTSLHKYGSN